MKISKHYATALDRDKPTGMDVRMTRHISLSYDNSTSDNTLYNYIIRV